MLKIEIYESTSANMLRAIKAACDELLKPEQAAQHNSRAVELHAAAEAETDKAAGCLTAENEARALKQAFDQAVEKTGDAVVAKMLTNDPAKPHIAEEILTDFNVDSTGAEWDAELHASTKTKNNDGTWKKRRGAATPIEMPPGGQVPPSVPPLPPTPPTPPSTATADPDSEKKIWALISGGVVTISQVQEVAAKHGCADLGALRGASADVKAAVLAELEQLP